MADENPADDTPVTFNIKSGNDAKLTVTISLSETVAQLKEKLSSKDFADIPADRQRLIYSGRVLKDDQTLASYKIQAGNTLHLVKGAASNIRQNPANSGTPTPAALPTNLSAGTGNNPLAGLTGARYAGFAQLPNQDMFGPDGGMGPPPGPEDMLRMLQNPQFASTLNEALSNPATIDMMIQSNPMLREMGPQVRQMLQSPEFRRMMTDPEQMRSMMQMQRMFGGGGLGMGGRGGDAAFPAPGVTDTTPESQQQQGQQRGAAQQQPPPFNPFAAFGQPQGQQQQPGGANPFAALFNPAMFGNTPAQTPPAPASAGQATPTGTDSSTTQPPTTNTSQPSSTNQQFPFPGSNPFANPAALQQLLASMNAQNTPGSTDAAGQNSFASLLNNPLLQAAMAQQGGFGSGGFGGGGFGAPPATQTPADTRPPEERYAEQLRQLNEMGFYEFERNIEALSRAGGNVQGAVEYLLTH